MEGTLQQLTPISHYFNGCRKYIHSWLCLWLVSSLFVLPNVIRKLARISRNLPNEEQSLCSTCSMLLSSATSMVIGMVVVVYLIRPSVSQSTVKNDVVPKCHTSPQSIVCLKHCLPKIQPTSEEEMSKSVPTENRGTMTDWKTGMDKAINTSLRPCSVSRSTGTTPNNGAKKKIRRAQKGLDEAIVKMKADKRAKTRDWRILLNKYRNKIIELMQHADEKNKLIGYVITSRMASQKNMTSAALNVRTLKERLDQQYLQNERQASAFQTKTTILKTMTHFISSTGVLMTECATSTGALMTECTIGDRGITNTHIHRIH